MAQIFIQSSHGLSRPSMRPTALNSGENLEQKRLNIKTPESNAFRSSTNKMAGLNSDYTMYTQNYLGSGTLTPTFDKKSIFYKNTSFRKMGRPKHHPTQKPRALMQVVRGLPQTNDKAPQLLLKSYHDEQLPHTYSDGERSSPRTTKNESRYDIYTPFMTQLNKSNQVEPPRDDSPIKIQKTNNNGGE